MEQNDLQQIKQIVDQSIEEKVDKSVKEAVDKSVKEAVREEFGQIWENNISPAFDDVYNKISQLPTKAYLDDKLADLEGGMISKLRKEDEKVNKIIALMKKHKLVPEQELAELDDLNVFPKVNLQDSK